MTFFLLFCAALHLTAPEPVPIQIECACTHEQQIWGLQGRKSIPEDFGMLFVNSPPSIMNLWSFNCYIDLSVAFLDANGIIQEIAFLKAYPEKMDPKRPVNSVKDSWRYPSNDPIIAFFHQHGIHSKSKTAGALETNAHFFQKHNVQVGDIVFREGVILHPIEISQGEYLLSTPVAVAIKNVQLSQIQFFDRDDKPLKLSLKGSTVYCLQPVSKIKIVGP